MIYELPKSLEVCGIKYEIRSDDRAVLDICTALSDRELSETEKILVVLEIFYPDFENMPYEHYEEAVRQCFWFIDCGEDTSAKPQNQPKVMDWDQDFAYIVAPVNRVLGKEIREVDYLHWWSFVSAYNEIGDCTFAQIVSIRNKKARGKKLEKEEQDWYRQNRHLVDFAQKFTDTDKEIMKAWGV